MFPECLCHCGNFHLKALLDTKIPHIGGFWRSHFVDDGDEAGGVSIAWWEMMEQRCGYPHWADGYWARILGWDRKQASEEVMTVLLTTRMMEFLFLALSGRMC